MGVTCVLNYSVPEGSSGQQMVDSLQRRLKELGATHSGTFLVDCETYFNVNVPQRVCHILHTTDQPASCFAVLDNGVCLVADSGMDALMQKLKLFYGTRKNTRIEAKGQRYDLGDFVIKIGSVVLGQNTNFKGILLEVEYMPCVVTEMCWALLQEFISGFMEISSDSLPVHLKGRMSEILGPQDTVMQYLEHFKNFRNIATQPLPSR